MVLSDTAILRNVRKGSIRLHPSLKSEHLRPTGIRVHLGNSLLLPRAGQLVDLATPSNLLYDQCDLNESPYVLEPQSFVLASTLEKVQTAPDLLCTLDGRSTIARLGLTIHNAASVLDGTQTGWLTPVLEIANHGNMRIVLRPGIPIGMICFHRLEAKISTETSHDQYANQTDTTPPRIHLGASVLGLANRL